MVRSQACHTGRVVLAGLLLSAGCGTEIPRGQINSPRGTTTTVILIRHAERNEGLDPPLNEEGRARAQVLVDVLGNNGVTSIYSPDLIRNRQTVEPLAEALGLPINVVPVEGFANTPAVADELVRTVINTHAGGVVLIVGNIGPVTPLQRGLNEEVYRRLGGTGTSPDRYQDMYIINIPDEGPARFIRTIYGEPSSLD